MTLRIHSNASYLSQSQARSFTGGKLFLGTKLFNVTREYNGAILTLSKIMKNVISSTEVAEVGALFHNTKSGEPIRATLD